MINALTLDGGGIRGLFTASVIRFICKLFPKFLDNVHVIGGTSTGGIIAMGLAAGKTPDEIIALYYNNANKIFKDSFIDDILDMGNLSGAKYGNSNFKKILIEQFGNLTLGELRKRVVIPTFQLMNWNNPNNPSWKPKIYHNFDEEDNDHGMLVYDVALMTSAAPTYFPTYKGHIDGGVVANNPSAVTVSQIINEETFPFVPLEEINLLSIVTGINEMHIPIKENGKQKDWGLLQWGKYLIDIMIDGVMGIADYSCAALLDGRYMRINKMLDHEIPMDTRDKDLFEYMINLPESMDFKPVIEWLEQHWTV